MAECVGANGRLLTVRVDCSLAERERGSLVQCLTIQYLSIRQTMQLPQLIFLSCLASSVYIYIYITLSTLDGLASRKCTDKRHLTDLHGKH